MSEQASTPRHKRVFSYYGDDMGQVLTEDGRCLRPGDGRGMRGRYHNRALNKRNRGKKPRSRRRRGA